MFESITISFEGDDNMSVNIMRIFEFVSGIAALSEETQAERDL